MINSVVEGSRNEIVDLYDAVKVIVTDLEFCQDLIQEKVLLK